MIKKYVALLTICYIAIALAVCFLKYYNFQYNALDLGIFNQVFYNTAHGQWLNLTIHSTSYLGDHFTPIIFLLLPFYYLYQSPITLLILQTLFIALAVIPLYLIAKDKLSPKQTLFICALFLFNPITIAINIFEFHLLPLIILVGLWAFYFYDQQKFKPYLLFILLLLLINEDVSFIVFSFGLLALFEKRKLKWILIPILISTAYFFIAIKIISLFATDGSSKFLIYYSWLGNNLWQIAINFFIKFPLVLQHLLNFQTIMLILGLITAFLFLPVLKPKYLILCLPSFLEFNLSAIPGNILNTHYASPFVLALIIGSIFALNDLKFKWFINYKFLVTINCIFALIYLQIVWGPYLEVYKTIVNPEIQAKSQLSNSLIHQLPQNSSLITSYSLLPNLSSRPKVYLLSYIFLGVQQYSTKPYQYELTDYVLIDFDDLIDYQLQYQKNKLYPNYFSYSQNIYNLLKNYELIEIKHTLALFKKNSQTKFPNLTISPDNFTPAKIKINDQLEITEFQQLITDRQLALNLQFRALTQIAKNYQIRLTDKNSGWQKNIPLAYGIYPTSQWQKDELIDVTYNLILPEFKKPQLQLQLIELEGFLELTSLGTAKRTYTQEKLIGSPIF